MEIQKERDEDWHVYVQHLIVWALPVGLVFSSCRLWSVYSLHEPIFLYWLLDFNPTEVLVDSRSVMPWDTMGRTRHTMIKTKSKLKTVVGALAKVGAFSLSSDESKLIRQIFKSLSCLGLNFAIVVHEWGIFSKHNSWNCVDCVTGSCPHRPSLLPIDVFGEQSGDELVK